MEIKGIPESVDRDKLVEVFRDLGFNPNSTKQITISHEGVVVEVYNQATYAVTTNTIYIPYVDQILNRRNNGGIKDTPTPMINNNGEFM